VAELRACREALRPYFAGLKLGLLEKRIAGLADEWERHDTQVKRIEQRRDAQRAAEDELKRSIADNGGDRLERLAVEIHKQDQERQMRERKGQRYAELVRAIGERPFDDEAGFLGQGQRFSGPGRTSD